VSCAPPADQPAPQAAQSPDNTLYFFTRDQAAVIEAITARIIPTDDNGPGAKEAGVVSFIDRQLASAEHFRHTVYSTGPFAAGLPTQGDQSQLSMRDRYRIAIEAINAYGKTLFSTGSMFPDLTPDQQDTVLKDMELGQADEVVKTLGIEAVPVDYAGTGSESIQYASPSGKVFGLAAFFATVRGHTIAGFFADPIHGGNRGMVGWKLIGFPGAQMGGYRDWILNYGVPFDGPTTGLAGYHEQLGRSHQHAPSHGTPPPQRTPTPNPIRTTTVPAPGRG
jgi:gluconate 2-dehydrogenase gamma chain